MRATRQRAGSAPTVVRLAEANGSSPTGFDAAMKAAVRKARAETDDAIAVEVTRQWADLTARGVGTYHVAVKVAYRQSLKAPQRSKRAAT